MAKCAGCGKFLSSKEAATCSSCPFIYHKVCVAIPDSGTIPKSWMCPECKRKIRKGDNSNTPVKGIVGSDSLPTKVSAAVSGLAPPEGLQSSSSQLVSLNDGNEYREMRRELTEYMAEIRDFRKEMVELHSSLAGIDKRLDQVEQRLDGLEKRELASGVKDTADLEDTVAQLKLELNDRDQGGLMSDLDIGYLPEEKEENIIHTISILAVKLGVKLETRDIVFAERIGTIGSTTAASTAGGVQMRTRRIVVRLARRHLRDELLQAARVRRNFTTLDMGLPGPAQRIYINERLTSANRLLFYQVREECRKRNWRYAWIKRGRIYAKQGEGKQAYLLRNVSDFLHVFNVDSV